MPNEVSAALDLLAQAKAAHDPVRKNELIDSAINVLSATNGPALSWQEEDVLEMLKAIESRPGQPINPQQCVIKWGTTGKALSEMWLGFDELEAKGFIGRNQQQTEFLLTEAGYQQIR